ncbi:T9SS type A sorting domain-containing protein, partial [bacterium]|nr:T9SS type A sorting domain-containing protein [bacterium]
IGPVGWVATSVDYASDGTAWIGNGLHSQIPDSKDQLLHIDQNGTILDSLDLAARPKCIRVDRSDGSVWILSDSLYKYTPSQHHLDGIVHVSGLTLSMDDYNNLIWVATYSDVRSYTKDGTLQTVIDNFDGSCQRHVATPMQTILPPGMSLIAHYPLRSHANDSTGNNTPMTLTNTPFQDGGIYCNGNYFTSPSCGAVTPYINNFNFDSFAIKAKFKVSEYPTGRRPVFVGGGSNRWLAYYLDHNGTITLKYNNNNFETSDVTYSLDTWHEATITYIDSVAKLYLDNVLAISYKFAMNHGNDNNVGITDFANGNIFKGIFSDLRIYSGDVETKVEENTSGAVPESFTLYQNYPNPFNASTKIYFDIPDRSMTTLTIYDIMGHEVKTLINEVKEKGRHQVVWNGDNNAGQNVSSGLYMYRLRSGDTIESHKMLLIR